MHTLEIIGTPGAPPPPRRLSAADLLLIFWPVLAAATIGLGILLDGGAN